MTRTNAYPLLQTRRLSFSDTCASSVFSWKHQVAPAASGKELLPLDVIFSHQHTCVVEPALFSDANRVLLGKAFAWSPKVGFQVLQFAVQVPSLSVYSAGSSSCSNKQVQHPDPPPFSRPRRQFVKLQTPQVDESPSQLPPDAHLRRQAAIAAPQSLQKLASILISAGELPNKVQYQWRRGLLVEVLLLPTAGSDCTE